MAKEPERTDRLPNAPLAEVVFELRWELQSGPASAPILQSDPGLMPLLDRFTGAMAKARFPHFKDMSHPLQTGAHGVARRFYRAADQPFPLMQVGPGIFATNESSLYTWRTYKKQIDRGVKLLLDAYPKLEFFAFKPIQLELRYIDVFGKSLLGNSNLFHFTEHGTSLKFRLPSMLNNSKIFVGDATGRFRFLRKVRGWKGTLFSLDLGSAKNQPDGEDTIRMETKITTTSMGVPVLKTHPKFMSELDDWLEFAHGITSPFFKEFILPEVMSKFGDKQLGVQDQH